jgi:hypothetical protein
MAVKGHSVEIAHSETSGGTYTKIANLVDLDMASLLQAEDIDVSHMESVDQIEETEPGWAAGQEFTATWQYAKAVNATVYALFRQKKFWKVTFSDGSTWVFPGYLKDFGNTVERKGIITLSLTMKIAGAPTFTAGT